MTDRRLATNLLLHAGRLLLEYNESTGEIHRALDDTAKSLSDERCRVSIAYHEVAVSLADDGPAHETVPELRYNAALQTRVHEILDQVRRGALDAVSAQAWLSRAETDTPRHSRWLVALLLGCAAASFARLLCADVGGLTIAGVASSLGLLARQELGRRHCSLLTLPLTAAFIGALLGGFAIRQGWTRSPELVVVVPALMLVPGPHLINGLLDMIDNQVPMSLSRLGLATAILLASALGIVLGVELTIPDFDFSGPAGSADQLNLASDMVLAGIATCGFAVFFNVPWSHLGLAAAGGMAGHGVRFLMLEAGARPEAAAFLGGLTVGAISGWMARRRQSPVAVTAFAGAVTMIPGLSLYRALSSARQLALLDDGTHTALLIATLGFAFQACLVVGGLGLGLIIGARLMLAFALPRSQAQS